MGPPKRCLLRPQACQKLASVGEQNGAPWGGLAGGGLQGRQLSAGIAGGRQRRPCRVNPRHQRFCRFENVGDPQRLRQPCSTQQLLSNLQAPTALRGTDARLLHAKIAIKCLWGPYSQQGYSAADKERIIGTSDICARARLTARAGWPPASPGPLWTAAARLALRSQASAQAPPAASAAQVRYLHHI